MTHAIKQSLLTRITLWTSLGSMVEYYDFVVYAMMAKYFAASFFPTDNETLALLQSFLVFAMGYFARPLGGTLIGIMGDRLGRKPAFLMLTGLMSASTLAIAFLPTYETCGVVASILLVVCRVGQGLSLGGELPGACTIISEFAPKKSLGIYNSFLVSSTTIGAILATTLLFVLTTLLSQEQILSFGWRIPFVIGGILGAILLGLRLKLLETPAFREEHTLPQNPFIRLLKEHFFSVIKGIGLTVFFAGLIILNIFFPYFIPKYFGHSSSDVYFSITLSLIFSALIFPILGLVADRLQKKNLLLHACSLYIIFSIPLTFLLLSHSTLLLVFFLMSHQFFIALYGTSYFPLMSELFPTSVRYTGLAVCYNLAFAVLALLPSFLTYLLHISNFWSVPLFMMGLACVSFAAAFKLPAQTLQKKATA